MFEKIKKRDGRIVKFDQRKITDAILKAGQETKEFGLNTSRKLSNKVVKKAKEIIKDKIPTVEKIQDIVETVLIESGYIKTAKAYIIYRDQHAKIRDVKRAVSLKLVDEYIENEDWRVNENSNMTYSLQGLNNHIASVISAHYWLYKIYPKDVRKAHICGDFHIHDLALIAPYCAGWNLKDLLIRGFGGVPGKIESKPAKHFRAALGQIVNFFYTLQGETAGAEAFSSVDTYLAPFIKYDKLSYKETKQAIQEFLFNINIPTRVGFQSLVWDELVVIRENGKIKIKKIGEIVDSQFEKKSHRVLEDNPGSFAIENDDNFKVLSFNQKGEAVWANVKAFIRHKVPKGSKFVKVRTSKGTASVSPAHSLFRFEKLNGEFIVKPFSAQEVRDEHFNSKLKPNNHFIAIKSVKNEGNKKKLDLLEILQEFPYLWQKVYVNVPEGTIDKLKEKVKEYYGGITPFYIQFNLHNRSVWIDWKRKKIVRLDIFLKFLEENDALGFYLRNSKIKTSRFLKGKDLLNFVKICAWYMAEGHADISNSFFISQSELREIKRILKSLGILGRIEKSKGYSQKGNKTKPVYKISGNGLLTALVVAVCGTYSTRKEVPWFVYQLEPKLQEAFIKSILSGDGSEYEKYWDLSTTSKKLSTGLSLLLSMNGYKFSVYEEEGRKKEWSNQYTLRIYKDKKRKEAYSVGDFTARICSRLEEFKYDKEFEYDLSVDLPRENFSGGAGLLLFHNTPFTNVTMDLVPPSIIADEHVIIGGKMQNAQYGEFQKEIDTFNKAFAEVMSEGDAKGRVFTFPIPTYNITEDFNWDNPTLESIWTMTSKYGTPYFANFIHSDMKPEDATSMCCRLRIDQRELRKRGGGFFAANPLTGSIGVATINMPRIGYFSKDEKEFFDRLKEKMDLAKKSLEIKRKVLERFTENNLYPYAKYYLNSIKKRFRGYWRNHFSTIGLIGMNEACLNFLGKDITTQEGRDFCIRVLDFMREKLMDYQNETDNIYNLEATPGEGAAFRLAKTDKEKFPEIICANEEAFKNGTAPYYTNSTQLPVGYTDDIFEALDLQDELQTKYTGGTVFHGFIGEKLPDGESSKILVKKIAENYRLPYFTITPTFSICPQDGYLSGEHETCPECGAITEVYSRVVGYIRPIKQWNKGKKSEFKDRKNFLIDKKVTDKK